MIMKNIFQPAVLCTTLLAWSGLSMADEYRPDEFLGLDLAKAVLSPKRLGPASEFAPVAVEARTDPRKRRARKRAWNRRLTPKSVAFKEHRCSREHCCSQEDAGAYAQRESARRGSSEARAKPRQSARCGGARIPAFRSGRASRVGSATAEAEELNCS